MIFSFDLRDFRNKLYKLNRKYSQIPEHTVYDAYIKQ